MKSKPIYKVLFLIGLVLALMYAFPFFLVVINAFKDRQAIVNDPLSLPKSFSFENFVGTPATDGKVAQKGAIQYMGYWQALLSSLIVTITSVGAIIIVSSSFAYYLSRTKTKLSTTLLMIMVASMVVPFQSLMLPFVAFFGGNGLNFPGNRWVMAFYYVGFGTALSTFLYHGFISSIPRSLDEAAAIDGASPFRIYRSVIFPLLRPVTATVAIINALWVWNDFLLPSLVLIDPDQKTLPLRTYVFYGQYTAKYGLAMAGLLLSIIPIIIFYFVMQKRIIAGISAGAVK